MGTMGREWGGEDELKKVSVMNFRDMLPSPMSRPVAVPQGPMREI